MYRRNFNALFAASVLAGLTVPAIGAETEVELADFYESNGAFSQTAWQLSGQRIALRGFMAPLLKADSEFFVLTTYPVDVCPFCAEEGEWPEDIAVIYTQRKVRELPNHLPVVARGVLEIGVYTDPETKFVSMLRLSGANFRRAD